MGSLPIAVSTYGGNALRVDRPQNRCGTCGNCIRGIGRNPCPAVYRLSLAAMTSRACQVLRPTSMGMLAITECVRLCKGGTAVLGCMAVPLDQRYHPPIFVGRFVCPMLTVWYRENHKIGEE